MASKLGASVFGIERGDIVVFRDPGGWLAERHEERDVLQRALSSVGLIPGDENEHLVKRVIGLPGDHVECGSDSLGRITVNGEPLDEPYLPTDVNPSDIHFDVTVPEGHLFVLGDNRSNSLDSRFNQHTDSQGFVPETNVVGTGLAVYWPLNHLASIND